MKKIKRVFKTKNLQEAEKVFKESHVMVILEDMRDGIKLLAEGQTGLQRQLDEVKVDARSFRDEMYRFRAETNARFDQMDAGFDQMNAEFKEVKANQKITLEHLFNIEERIEALEKEVREIKLELAALGKKILSPEENSSFNKRISATEKEVKKIWGFINAKTNLKSA
ncbi:MAG: hypothetical protein WCO05_03985 [Candidatus Moraniibacteriota bacterium]